MSRQRFTLVTLLLILLATLLAGCTPAQATPPATEVVMTEEVAASPTAEAEPGPTTEPTTATTPEDAGLSFTDDLGRTMELNGPAQRIATLGPSIVESLFAIGAGGQIVGREEFSTYPPEAEKIPSVGSLFGNLPSEAILALEPDLVIAPEIISEEQVEALSSLGLTVYYQKNPTTFNELYANLRELAALAGREDEAETLIDDLSFRVEAVAAAMEDLEERPTVFYELDATDPSNPYTTGGGTFIDTLITLAGGENIGKVLSGEYAQISSEQIIAADPQVILLADAPYGITAESVAARAGWSELSAVREGRVLPFDPFLTAVPGPRLVEGLEAMAAAFHPDLFPVP